MATSDLWDRLDPAASFRVPTTGYDETSTDPSRQTRAASAPLYSPQHPQFGFGVAVLVTGALAYYVFERGAGASVKGRVGKASAAADVALEGAKK
jgi:hypothetical protein